jgi:hypothetical protein
LLELLLITLSLLCRLVSLLLRFSKNSWILNFLFWSILQLSSWSNSLISIFLEIFFLLELFLLSYLRFGSFVDLDRHVIIIGILILVHHLSTSHSYLILDFWLNVSQIRWIFTCYLSIAVIFLIICAILDSSLSWLITLSFIYFFQVILRSVLYHNYLMLRVILINIYIFLWIFFTLLIFVNWRLI